MWISRLVIKQNKSMKKGEKEGGDRDVVMKRY